MSRWTAAVGLGHTPDLLWRDVIHIYTEFGAHCQLLEQRSGASPAAVKRATCHLTCSQKPVPAWMLWLVARDDHVTYIHPCRYVQQPLLDHTHILVVKRLPRRSLTPISPRKMKPPHPANTYTISCMRWSLTGTSRRSERNIQ